MTETATQLLAKIETLSASEQHELIVEMLRRSRELPNDFFLDEHLVRVADDLFQQLDHAS